MRRPVTDDKCSKKKAPRKIHKAEREKHKRDLLNDLFGKLGEMLGEWIDLCLRRSHTVD